MNDETKIVTEQEVLVSVKRHINMGERSFQNAETTFYALSAPILSRQLETSRLVRAGLNEWEMEERKNYLDMQKFIEKQEEAHAEKARFEYDKKNAEFRKELLEYMEKHPECGIDELLLTFELSRYTLGNHLDSLANQGKLKRDPRRVNEEPDPEDFNEPAEGEGKQYVTVKLVGTTIRIEKLRFCKEHGDQLRSQISQAVIHAMRGATYEFETIGEE